MRCAPPATALSLVAALCLVRLYCGVRVAVRLPIWLLHGTPPAAAVRLHEARAAASRPRPSSLPACLATPIPRVLPPSACCRHAELHAACARCVHHSPPYMPACLRDAVDRTKRHERLSLGAAEPSVHPTGGEDAEDTEEAVLPVRARPQSLLQPRARNPATPLPTVIAAQQLHCGPHGAPGHEHWSSTQRACWR
jgi:hypothetical protein